MPKKKTVEAPTVYFNGQSFEVTDPGSMPMMRFARFARTGIDSDDYEGMAAMYDLLKACIAPAAWDRFERVADESKCDGDTLFGVVRDTFAVIAGRPTSRPSDSSDGSPTTGTRSTAGSSSRVIKRLESEGRPDLALLVQQHAQAG